MKIEDVRTFILSCEYLDADSPVNVNYLGADVISYSITESASYNPLISKDIIGNEKCQFLFNLDAKLNWNEKTQTNIDSSNFFNNFSSWIKSKNESKEFPSVSDGIEVNSIRTISNGYIYATDSEEAVYRISCEILYTRNK